MPTTDGVFDDVPFKETNEFLPGHSPLHYLKGLQQG